jgi:hypothetical protein
VSPFTPDRAPASSASARGALLVVDTDRAAWLPAGAPIEQARATAFAAEDPVRAANTLRELLGAPGDTPRGALTVLLADGLVKYFVVEPPAGLRRLVELRGAAQARFEALFGLDAAAWRIDADWHPTRGFLACAAPAALLGQIEQAASRTPKSIAPLTVDASNACAPASFDGWIVCRCAHWVSATCWSKGACRYVRSVALPPARPLPSWLAQEALLAAQPLRDVLLIGTAAEDLKFEAADVNVRRPSAAPRGLQLADALARSALPD